MPKFSVCIPNYNYARYLKETVDSVLTQSVEDIEIVISDNCSTDESLQVIQSYDDPRVVCRVNPTNIGFSMNLLRAAEMAKGRHMIMLSSDDLMRPGALEVFDKLFSALGDTADTIVAGSSMRVIDEKGHQTGERRIDPKLWAHAQIDQSLSEICGAPVYRTPAHRLLRSCLSLMRTPYAFLATVYPRRLSDAIGGYSQGGIINPDKKFVWALLGAATEAFFVDASLFAYRIHAHNQGALQQASGALKHTVDEYIASFNTPPELLNRAGLSSHEFEAAFVEQDIALRGLKALAEGDRKLATRLFRFGQATYPELTARNKKAIVLRLLTTLGPLGSVLARVAMARTMRGWAERLSASEDSQDA